MNIKDFKWTEKRFGTRFAKILKGLGFSDENTEDIKVTDANGKVNTLVTDSNFKSILAKNGTLTEVTYQELKDKRDAGKLTPGALYRITDYQCTTTQENTRSAGHQFDIVLLALSENKLAEEGWAMEHPTDVYDVTFADGVTKKCYIYIVDDENCNVVLCDTLLGIYGVVPNDELIINETEKTATLEEYDIENLDIENLPYNYFQNSNLSAWKVWYCLDNDTTRFDWADDSVDEGSPAKINNNLVRSVENDVDGKYAWYNTVDNLHRKLYTDKEIPEVGDTIYYQTRDSFGEYGTVSSFTPAHEGTGPNGRGVIYRLIDEWNNDVPYDFKNIQFIRKINNTGVIEIRTGTDTYVYTFSVCNEDTKEFSDYSVTCKTFLDDEGGYALCYENKIKKVIDIIGELYILNNVVFHSLNIPNDTTRPMHHNTCVHTLNLTIGYGNQAIENNIFIYAGNRDYDSALGNNIIVQNTHATFENIT